MFLRYNASSIKHDEIELRKEEDLLHHRLANTMSYSQSNPLIQHQQHEIHKVEKYSCSNGGIYIDWKVLSFGRALCKGEWMVVRWCIMCMACQIMELMILVVHDLQVTQRKNDSCSWSSDHWMRQSFRMTASGIMVKLTMDTLVFHVLYTSRSFPPMYQSNKVFRSISIVSCCMY